MKKYINICIFWLHIYYNFNFNKKDKYFKYMKIIKCHDYVKIYN